MKEVLNNLNKVDGVRGSLIVGRDGLVVLSEFAEDMEENTIAAFASSVVSALENALEKMKRGTLTRFLITGEKGRVVLESAGNAILIVMLDSDSNLGLALLEIKNAAGSIQATFNR